MKKAKSSLKRDQVSSTGFHVGIELELKAPGGSSHNDDACYDSRYESQRDYLEDLGATGILREYMGLSRDHASQVEPYFDEDRWIDDYMRDWYDDGCQGDCGYGTDGYETRSSLCSALTRLTGNESFKVVEDGSIRTDSDETDAEVCWNYFASKETIRDNEKILNYLDGENCTFDSSCGLHINLNNYLAVKSETNIPVTSLDFLFDFVAPSRRGNQYCTASAISRDRKYSMIYEQGDRLEFRFFSPTLSAEKLNHYVSLANVIYRRLAGKDAKLSRKATEFFIAKIQKHHGKTESQARESIEKVNSIPSIGDLENEVQAQNEALESAVGVA